VQFGAKDCECQLVSDCGRKKCMTLDVVEASCVEMRIVPWTQHDVRTTPRLFA